MAQKKLQKDSLYEEYDLDGDGVVSDTELVAVKAIQEAETQEEKADAQRQMAWVSLIVMIIFTALVFLPAGVVGAYMGMTAYMSAKK